MRFQVTAVNGRGVVSTLELEASNPAEAITLASGQGWAAVAVKEVGSKLSWSIGNSTRFSLLLFSQELLSLLDSGISMVEALETLASPIGIRYPQARLTAMPSSPITKP